MFKGDPSMQARTVSPGVWIVLLASPYAAALVSPWATFLSELVWASQLVESLRRCRVPVVTLQTSNDSLKPSVLRGRASNMILCWLSR
jgi:hypothetical protein